MVNLTTVHASNALLPSLGPGKIALFVGATSGIGLATLTAFARNADRPRVYIVGRNEQKLSTIIADLQKVNGGGVFVPILSEIRLFSFVDAACEMFKQQEKRLDLLVMSPGQLKIARQGMSWKRERIIHSHTACHKPTVEPTHQHPLTLPPHPADNEDGISESLSFTYYLRMRFIHSLLPHLLAAPTARILSIHFAGKEGRLIESDLLLQRSYSFPNAGMHTATMTSLALEAIAAKYETISCVHVYPGLVFTEGKQVFTADWPWVLSALWHKVLTPLLMPLSVGLEESGARNCYLATSGRYPARGVREAPEAGVERAEGISVARGSDWEVGSGCYLLSWAGEEVGKRELMESYRERGMGEKIWEHTREVFEGGAKEEGT